MALVRDEAGQMPPWYAEAKRDRRFANIEADFSWWRTWDSLTDDERGRKHVIAWDRNTSYATPWRSLELGVEGLVHRTGDEADWDGKELPGYYLVDAWEWEQ